MFHKKAIMIGLIGVFVLAGAVAPVWAQSFDNKTPVEIEADQAIEWLRDQKQYIARGNALATQGDYSVKGDSLIADYRDDEGGSTTIWQITADGNVELKSGDYSAVADKAVFNVDDDRVTLTGGNLAIKSQTTTLTAQDKIVYDRKKQQVEAIGRPKARQGNKVVEAGRMIGFLNPAGQRGLSLERVEASDNVVIVTDTEVLKSDRATYDLTREQVTLTGQVKITREGNQLNGDRAVLDMVKGTSTLSATPTASNTTGRVKGLFFLDKSSPTEPTGGVNAN